MRQTLSLLVISTLLFASCSKDDAVPAPNLEGRWYIENKTDYSYDFNGVLTVGTPIVLDARYRVDITSDSVTTTNISDAHPFRAGQFVYTRQGTTLTNRDTHLPIEITELTAHSLALRFRGASSFPRRLDIEYKYTR